MKLYSIPTGNFMIDGGAMFGVVPKVLWQKLYPADNNNLCNWAMRCLLVVDEKKKILIDTGIGNKQDKKFFEHYHLNGTDSLEKSLKKAGLTPDDITDVILTHLHFDHCGGAIKKDKNKNLELTFPNANYWVSRSQWYLAMNPNRREEPSMLKENFMLLQKIGHLKFINSDTENLFPKFSVKLFDGHTDGQIISFIQYKGTTIVFMGDLIPSAAHIHVPYIPAYDTRTILTLDEKEDFLQEAVNNKYILFFEHDLYNECCTVKKTENRFAVKDTFKLHEI